MIHIHTSRRQEMIAKAKYFATIDQNEVEDKAITTWELKLSIDDKKFLLECAGYSDKYADMEFKDLTPSLKEMVKFVTLNVYSKGE